MDISKGYKAKILIVDDDILISESTKSQLKKANYNIVGTAINYQEAIQITKEFAPDLILMDINLRGSKDGITTAEEIQKFTDIPFIFTTAYSDSETIERAKKIGPFGYLIKPFETRDLLVSIETSLYKFNLDKKNKEQELLFRTVANFAYEWEFWILPDLTFKYCSPSCERVTGYRAENFLEKPSLLFDIVHPDDLEIFAAHMESHHSIVNDAHINDLEFRIISKDGKEKYIKHTCNPIYDEDKKYLGRRVTNVDITDTKLAEISLRESEQNFRTIANSGSALLWTAGTDKLCNYFNDRWLQFTGRTLEQELGNGWTEGVHPDDLEKCVNIYSGSFDRRESFSMVYRVRRHDGEFRWILDEGTPRYDSAGNFIGYIGHCFDITERIQAEKALKESEKRFRLLYENAPLSYQSLDKNGYLIDVNPTWLKTLGFKREEVVGRHFTEFMTKDSAKLVESRFPAFMKAGEIHNYEFEMIRKDKSHIWVTYEGNIGYDKLGNFKQTHCIFTDITERKLQEKTLRESEERYRSLIDNMMDGVYRSTHEGKFTEVNPAMVKMFGYSSKEEMLEVDIKKDLYFTPEERESLFLDVDDIKVETFLMRRKDGSPIWVEDHGHYVRDNKGNVLFHEGILRDVTERKLAEDALIESEKRYKDLFNDDLTGDYIVSVDGTILLCNPALAKIFGCKDVDEMMTKNVNQFYKDSDRKVFLDKVYKNKKLINYEHDLISSDGQVISIIENVIGEFDDKGNLVRMKGYMFDNTERKKAEKALRESEERYRLIMENSMDGILLTEPNGNILSANAAACKMLRRTEDELCKIGRNGIVDISDPRLMQLLEERSKNGRANGELNLIRKDGTKFPAEVSSTLFYDGEGNVKNGMIIRDITERKQAEEEIKKNEERYLKLVNTSLDGYWIANENGKIIEANEAYCEMSGYKLDELKNMYIKDLEASEDEAEVHSHINKIIKTNYARFETKHKRSDGKVINVIVSTHFLKTQKNFIVFITNITNQKLAEKALIESEKRYRDLVEGSPDAISIYNKNGDIIYVNGASLSLVKASSPDELIGKPAIQFVHPDYRNLALDRIKNLFETQRTLPAAEEKFLRLDGSDVDVEVIAFPISFNYQPAVQVIVRDITERKKFQEELISQLDEINRFNKQMVGREEKMIDLKKEINTLLKNLGQPQKYNIGKLLEE